MTTLVMKPNYITNNYYKLEKRKKEKKKHIYTLKSYKKYFFYKYFIEGNCMPSFHKLDGRYRKMIDYQQTRL